MTHPVQSELALFAGGDLGFLHGWRVRRHITACEACQHEIDAFRSAAASLRSETSELPAELDWDRLSAEMTANIHLGLEAGECVGPVKDTASVVSRPFLGWRAAAVTGAMAAVLLAAWALNPPQHRPSYGLRASPRIEIRNTANGLELNENGNALVLLHGRGVKMQRPIIVSAPGTLKARFVDDETDQITINHIYAE